MAEGVFTPGRTLSVRRLGPVVLQTAAPVRIADDEWAAYLRLTLDDIRTNGFPRLAIQCTHHETPSRSQRRRLVAAVGPDRSYDRFALVTGSALVRGAMTALRWAFGGTADMRTFAPGREPAALAWLAAAEPFDAGAALELLARDAQVTGYPGFKR